MSELCWLVFILDDNTWNLWHKYAGGAQAKKTHNRATVHRGKETLGHA